MKAIDRIILQHLRQWPKLLIHGAVAIVSVFLCLSLLLLRLPGTEIAGVGANWLLIWVVSWSLKRDALDGAIAGLALGLVLDGLTMPLPSHALGLILVGTMTALLQKERYIQEDFISVALIVFGMAVIYETVLALQFSVQTQVQDWFPTLLDGPGTPLLMPGGATSGAGLNLEIPTDPTVVNRVGRTMGEIWLHHQQVALSSAIVSSLWAPILYYPLNLCWQWIDRPEE